LTGLLFHPRSSPKPKSRGARLGHSPHERRVAQLSLKLFDLLRSRHKLSDRHRDLLATAALVHDAAKDSSPADHDVRGAELVLADGSLSLTPAQRRAVAFLVRYHRDGDGARAGAPPVRGYDVRALMTLLAVLHAADGLDSRRVPVSAIIVRRKARALDVTCLVSDKLVKARRVLGRRRKFKLLSRVLGVEVRVRVERALDEAPTR
jgi:exopolyphosphatase/pppGpp-phosphohydrolase